MTDLIPLLGLPVFGAGAAWTYLIATSTLDEGLRWYDVSPMVVGGLMIVLGMGG